MQQLRPQFAGKDVFPSLGSPPLFCHRDELSVAACRGTEGGQFGWREAPQPVFVSSGLSLSPSPAQLQWCLQVKKLSLFICPQTQEEVQPLNNMEFPGRVA